MSGAAGRFCLRVEKHCSITGDHGQPTTERARRPLLSGVKCGLRVGRRVDHDRIKRQEAGVKGQAAGGVART